MLWALMIYWIVSALLPLWRVVISALLAGLVATLIELLKLYHVPWLDSSRLTVPGILVLGRIFSVSDILAYWFAIILGAAMDSLIRPEYHLALDV